MKNIRIVLFVFTLMFTFLLLSCAAPTPMVIVVTATPLPPTETPAIAPTATLAPVALAGPQAGTTMKWIDGSTLAYIPLSEFIMGNDDFNAPVHKVTLDGFWIYTTKVTNRMYAQCVAVGACTPPTQDGGAVYSNPEFSNHPVIGVTWNQSQAYCSWSQGQLPTEAQWEKAARGENGNLYPWGNTAPACNILSFEYCNGSTSEVGAFKDGASPYGLYDMAGNVFEWVNDWYSETYYKESALVNPTGPESGEYRVIRGSSFESYPDQIGSAIRHFTAGANHRRDIGFRCVIPNPQPVAPFCQLSAFIPTGVVSSTGCELPQTKVAGIYCANGNSFATINLPAGAVYESTDKLKCIEAIVDGQRRLTCEGPRSQESTNEITVCNPNCSNSPDLTGAVPTCDSGYTLDPANSVCNYTPIVGQAGVAGCPTGYKLLDRGGQQTCVISTDANGQCPAGLYLDSLSNLCVSPNSLVETPYGIDNPTLASQLYSGCATGYTYSDTFQCCQAVTGGTYPGCPPGTKFDPELHACSPGKISLSGPGCVTLDVTTIKCSNPVDICSPIQNETRCIQTPQCQWDEKDGCHFRKP